MTDPKQSPLNRREFIQAAAAGAAVAALPAAFPLSAFAQNGDLNAVLSQIPKQHAQNVKRLQDWIALPSIAAENRNYPQGPEYMANLAEQAGFTAVKLIPTSGKPGVSMSFTAVNPACSAS